MSQEHYLAKLEGLALIAIGGFAGSNLRYFTGSLVPGLGGTLAVNVVGSFVLGFILYEAIHAGILARQTRVVVTTGFVSSFTTYSTFAVQTAQLGSPEWMVLNVVGNYALGFAGVFAGRALALRFEGGSA